MPSPSAWVPVLTGSLMRTRFASSLVGARLYHQTSRAPGRKAVGEGEEDGSFGRSQKPFRHEIPWRNDEYYDEKQLDEETRRIFDVCHGCRRCFNLCNSFPRLFDMIDESPTGELDSIPSKDFKPVFDDCTLCDMCGPTKCPYVAPHAFNLDFPHLVVRYRAVANKKANEKGIQKRGKDDSKTEALTGSLGESAPKVLDGVSTDLHLSPTSAIDAELVKTDRNGRLGCGLHSVANWSTSRSNSMTRTLAETIAGVHKDAELPQYVATSEQLTATLCPPASPDGLHAGRKVAIYASCIGNFNQPSVGKAAMAVLAKNGVDVEVTYPECCGMPQLEQGDVADVADRAERIAAKLRGLIDDGREIVGLTASCTLMMKNEWPLLLPNDENVKVLSQNVADVSEYLVRLSKAGGLAEGMSPLDGDISFHHACHARAQNIGNKGAELLKHIPKTKVQVVEKCSGHGGSWGVKKENFETAIKVGTPAMRAVAKKASTHKYVVSECPLAGDHILQGIEKINPKARKEIVGSYHPVELLAKSYGLNH